jgi:hypothetical protein
MWKTYGSAIAALAILALFASEVSAHRRTHRGPARGSARPHGPRLVVGPCTTIDFDSDGDGALSEEEILAAREARKAAILAQHDGDGDGELSDEERAAAREARAAEREARHAERVAQHDTDNDGELSEAERAAARAAREAERLAEFDADGSGDLDEEENAAARAARCAARDVEEEEEEGEEIVLALALSLDFIRGDVNRDQTVDIGDPVTLLNFLFLGGLAPPCMDAADSNDDGTIDLADSTATLTALFLGGTPLPEPSSPGGDSTLDDLSCDGIISTGF